MVIQRWQTVLLFIAAAVMACFTFIPFGIITTQDVTYNLTALGFYPQGVPTDANPPEVVHTWYFFMLSITTVVLLLLDIFLFKNIKLQQKVCMVAILFIIADGCVGGLLGFWAFRAEGFQLWWKTTALCPFIAVVGAILAYYRMAQDYSLLKAADRLR